MKDEESSRSHALRPSFAVKTSFPNSVWERGFHPSAFILPPSSLILSTQNRLYKIRLAGGVSGAPVSVARRRRLFERRVLPA